MIGYFKKIDLGFDEETSTRSIVPSWRQDLLRPADLAEEVARFYGYANIPTTLPSGEATTGKLSVQDANRGSGQRYRRILWFSARA